MHMQVEVTHLELLLLELRVQGSVECDQHRHHVLWREERHPAGGLQRNMHWLLSTWCHRDVLRMHILNCQSLAQSTALWNVQNAACLGVQCEHCDPYAKTLGAGQRAKAMLAFMAARSRL
jgi:hypothetical protein